MQDALRACPAKMSTIARPKFRAEKAKAQRAEITRLWSHSPEVVKMRSEPRHVTVQPSFSITVPCVL